MSDPSEVISQVSVEENQRNNVYVKMIILALLGIIVCIIIYNYFMVRVYEVKLNDSPPLRCVRMQNMGVVLGVNDAISPGARSPGALSPGALSPGALSHDTATTAPMKPSIRGGVSKGIETATPEDGKVKVIFYHAGWCPHCVRIMKDLIITHNNKKYSVYGYLKEKYANNPSIKIMEFQQDFDDTSDPLNDNKKAHINKEIRSYNKLRGFPTIRVVSKEKDVEYDGPRTKDDIDQYIRTF